MLIVLCYNMLYHRLVIITTYIYMAEHCDYKCLFFIDFKFEKKVHIFTTAMYLYIGQ